MPLPPLGIFDKAAGATTSFESIATVTVGSGGAANVEFTSIPSTYTHLQIRAELRLTLATTDDNSYIQFNSDTGNNYSSHSLYGSGSTVAATATSTTNNILAFRSSGANSSANIFGVGVFDILDYANTNKYKTTRNLTGHDQNGSGFIFFNSGLWQNTNAITSMKITPANGNFAQYSHFALYGIKSA